MSWFDSPRTVGGLALKGSFIMESGPFGHSGASIAACTQAGFAAVSTETISLTDGTSPWWNIYRVGGSLYNCSKWSDIPLEQWVSREIPYAKAHGATVIATVGHTVRDVEEIVPALRGSGVDAVKACTYHAGEIVGMVHAARRHTTLPVWAKISANWPDFLSLAEQCQQAGADALVAIDTLGPVAYWDRGTRPALGGARHVGWMSGEGIHGKALYVISALRERITIPIVGVGGIMDADGVLRARAAGADLFGLCSTILINGLGRLSEIQEALGRAPAPAWPEACGTGSVHIEVDPSRCDGCGRCVQSCGYMALALHNGTLTADDHACRRCGLCQQLCGAIRLECRAQPGNRTSTF